MKKITLIFFIIAIFLVNIQTFASVSVAFVNDTSNFNCVNVSKEVVSQLMSNVLNGSKFTLVTRQNNIIRQLINENQLSLSGLTTDAASQLKLMGISYFVVFSILNAKSSSYANTSPLSYILKSYNSTDYNVVYNMNVSIQVYDLSGRILVSKDLNEKGVGTYSYYNSSYGSGYTASKQEALSTAEQKAVNSTAKDMEMLLNNMILVKGKIIKQINGSSSNVFLINIGTNQGIQKGMKFNFSENTDGIIQKSGLCQVTATGPENSMITIIKWPSFNIVVGKTQVSEVPKNLNTSGGLNIWTILLIVGALGLLVIIRAMSGTM